MTTFPTPDPILAVVDIGMGRLDIRAGDRADTVVEVRPTNPDDESDVWAAEETRVELTGGQLLVRAPKSRSKLRSMFGRPPSIDVVVELPSDSRLDATVAADVHGQGRLGDTTVHSGVGTIRLDQTGRLRLRTGAGDVTVGRSTGPADLTTSAGKIRVGSIDGSAVLKTSNGEISLGDVTGDVRLNTANGDIAVDQAGADVQAKTAFGSIRVGQVVRGSVSLETSFGELEIGIREGTAAWLDVSSSSGNVRSQLDNADEPGPTDETVRVHARTSFGDILIRRAETVD